jgi:methylglutamate dehydrogenase subunit D
MQQTAAGTGILVRERHDMSVVAVAERKGKRSALEERVRQHFGIELPREPKRIATGHLAWVGVRFDSWLVTSAARRPTLVGSLRQALTDAGSVVEQSDGMSVLQLSGPGVREIFCRLVRIDVDPSVFRVSDVATTMMAGIRITLWRLDDLADGTSVFELAVPRSYVVNMRRVLAHTVAHDLVKMSL